MAKSSGEGGKWQQPDLWQTGFFRYRDIATGDYVIEGGVIHPAFMPAPSAAGTVMPLAEYWEKHNNPLRFDCAVWVYGDLRTITEYAAKIKDDAKRARESRKS